MVEPSCITIPDGSREFIFNLANSATSLIDADSVDATLTEGCRFFHVMETSLTSEGMFAAVKRRERLESFLCALDLGPSVSRRQSRLRHSARHRADGLTL
jgi:sugar/nucleoside kinase (ribokinase family)